MLVQEKLLTEDEAAAIQTSANTQQVPFVSQLVQSRKIPASKVAETAAHAFGFPLFDLNALNEDYLPAKGIDTKLMQSSRSEEHTSELQSLMRISYAVFCLK